MSHDPEKLSAPSNEPTHEIAGQAGALASGSALLPCPFCGAAPRLKSGKVSCVNPSCAVQPKIATWYAPGYNQNAIDDWNRRALHPSAYQPQDEVRRLAGAAGLERLESLRRKLCSVGLHPGYHDTAEKAAAAVCEMIDYFRRELENPPHDIQCLVLRNLGVEGFTEQEEPRCKIVSIPNGADDARPKAVASGRLFEEPAGKSTPENNPHKNAE